MTPPRDLSQPSRGAAFLCKHWDFMEVWFSDALKMAQNRKLKERICIGFVKGLTFRRKYDTIKSVEADGYGSRMLALYDSARFCTG